MIKKAALLLFALLAVSTITVGKYTSYVNPFIGTGAVEGGLSGNNHPGATVPFGMVQLGPDTHTAPDWYNASGYDYNDSIIYCFSHTRLSGTGASDLIDIALFPTVSGEYKGSKFLHSREKAAPGFYSVDLLNEGIRASMSATTRVGIHKYEYPVDSPCSVILDLDHSANKGSWNRRVIQSQIRQTGPRTIEGYRIITGWAKLRKVYFVAVFSEDIRSLELSDGNDVRGNATVINGTALKGLIGFGELQKPLLVRVALSGVSCAGAMKNLNAEAPHEDFDGYVAQADSLWEHELGRIEAFGDKDKLTTFYTALYHAFFQPNTFSDVDGRYMAPDYTIDQLSEGETQYTTFSLWDTYRAAHPLYNLLIPERNAAFINSMLRHYDHYGYLPIWHLWGQDNYCMIGNHAIPVIADAILRGVPGIDKAKAYEAVLQSSLQSHPNSPFDIWEKYGYMPENIQSQSVSITLEMAYDDWCVAQMAKALGHEKDYAHFCARSQYFRNLHDNAIGFFRGKDSDGKWMEPFDPLKFGANGGYPFTEGNAWQYYWYVPHDIEGLISLSGGTKAFENKLDRFFSITDTSGVKNDNISGCIGQYAHGNEPSHHVAYLYNNAQAPHKAQKMIRRILDEMYNNTSSGYAGNDDCGEMSAWYVFSTMGFYPVNPASGYYSIGTPLFDKCIIHLPGGKDFTITASRKRPQSCEVKRVTLNGKPIRDNTLSYENITEGGNLAFTLN